MRRFFAGLCVVLYLIGTTELSQFLKLGYLVDHYLVHKTENASISLLEFIDIHYLQAPIIDADYEEDMKLPFKAHNDNHSTGSSNYFFSYTSTVLKLSIPSVSYFKFYPANSSIHTSQFGNKVFQPPRTTFIPTV